MTIKTKTISLKISEKNENILKNESKLQDISLNSLSSRILSDWVNFQRHSERSDMIIFPKKIFQEVILTHSEEQLQKIAQQMSQHYTDLLLLKSTTELENVDKVLKIIFEKLGFGKISFEENENYFSLKVVHDLGEKGSILLKNLIENIFLNLYGIVPKVTHTKRILTLQYENGIILKNSHNHDNQSTSNISNMPFHMASSYHNKKELSKLLCSFIQKGIQKNMLNILIIQKKNEPYYISMFEEYAFTTSGNIKEEIEIVHSDNLFENGKFGESFEPIIALLDVASDIAKTNKKTGLNIIGTIAHDLLLDNAMEKCLKIEDGWKKIIPHYSPPIHLLCPHKAPLNKTVKYKLEEKHTEGFKKFEESLKILSN